MRIPARRILGNGVLLAVTIVVASLLYIGVRIHVSGATVSGFSSIFEGYTYLESDDVVFQQGKSDCGPAALMNVFAHYRIETTLEEISAFVGMTGKGTSMLKLKEMAESKGLEAEGWLYTWDDFRGSVLPAIAYVRSSHYVVVESIPDGESVIIIDPAVGRLRMSQREFQRIWSGETLQIEKADSTESAFSLEGYR